jgi:CheY-like chemotaxis protein
MNFLLIDDDQISSILATKILERTGLVTEIKTAWNGQEAISYFNRYFDHTMALPDVILLDVNMPVMDGFSFLEAFYKLPIPNIKKVQIIIVSSSDDKRDVERAHAMGIKHYFVKPLRADELIKAVTS